MSKKYWLRGGAIACVSLVIIYLVVLGYLAEFLCEYNDLGDIVCSNRDIFETFLRLSLYPFISHEFYIPFLILSAIFGFGALIGWFYDRIKTKNEIK